MSKINYNNPFVNAKQLSFESLEHKLQAKINHASKLILSRMIKDKKIGGRTVHLTHNFIYLK